MPLKQVLVQRGPSTDNGMFGEMTSDAFPGSFKTGELRKDHNIPNLSAFPAGKYLCKITPDKKMTELFGRDMYAITGIEGRVGVFIHPGNWCGDVEKKLKSDVEGCMMLGNYVGELSDQPALIESRAAIRSFMAYMEGEDFELTVQDAA